MKTPLVLIHYFGGNADSWQWMLPYLSNDLEVYSLSLPGFGNTPELPNISIDTMSAHIVDYLQQHQLKNCILAGHSMGGKLALRAATLDAEHRIAKVVLIAPSPPTVENMPNSEALRMLHRNYDSCAQTVANGTYATLSKTKKECCIQTQLMIAENTWRWWLLEGMHHDITSHTETLHTPLYLLYSEDDEAITSHMILEEVLPNLWFEEIFCVEHTGHLIPIEQPEFVADVLNEVATS